MDDFISIIQSLIRTIAEFFHFGYSLTEPPPKDPSYKAEFDPDQKTLSIFHEGFCLDGKRSLSLTESLRHAIVVGKSGIGKSTSTFFPSLLTMHTSGNSFVIHDCSRELYLGCAGHLRKQGYHVKVLDLSDPFKSIGWNPIEKNNDNSELDLERTVSMLTATTMKNKDPFWDTSSASLITIVCRLVQHMPHQFRNLHNVRRFIMLMNGNPKRADELMSKYADEKTYLAYKAFLANDPKVQSGITATSLASLSIFGDENVARVTSETTFRFKELRRRKIALFIQNPISDQRYFNVLISLWFEKIFAELLSDIPAKGEKSIYILLDEAASGLRMPSFAQAMAHFRKYKVGCLLGVQTIEQLKETYGDNDATTILSNCNAHMYFSGQSHATTKILSEMLGKYSYDKEDSKTDGIRNLMEPDEIRMMKKDNALVFIGSEKPILATLTPYYERFWLKLRAGIKPPMVVGIGKRDNEYIH